MWNKEDLSEESTYYHLSGSIMENKNISVVYGSKYKMKIII